jgi:signal transduction histidine kinase
MESRKGSMKNQSNIKILSVDDNTDNRYLLESVLRGGGYQVTSVTNGVEALNQLLVQPFDLILADILMPLMDGFELCRRVKQDNTMRHIPFVFYTATYTEKKDEELAMALGASRFIIKPVEPQPFLDIIAEVIAQAQTCQLQPAQPVEDQETLLRTYHYRLARKLDKKVAQLEALSHELQTTLEAKEREAAERRKVEAEVRALNAELETRVQSRTRELAIANRELEAFVAAVSHDLRSPLHRISGLAEILVEDFAKDLPQEARDCIARMSGESRRVSHLVDALFKLSQASRGPLRKDKIDLSSIASEIASDLRAQHPGRAVTFLAAPDIVAKGDPTLLRAVLQNLLDNAWKFTGKTENARIEFGRTNGERPAFFIRDNGAGFESNRALEVFAPFQRLHSGVDFPGTGIGLATVHQIIARHGGQIWAEGVPGKGATFFFTLPAA